MATYRSAEPVSISTLRYCGGDPTPIMLRYSRSSANVSASTLPAGSLLSSGDANLEEVYYSHCLLIARRPSGAPICHLWRVRTYSAGPFGVKLGLRSAWMLIEPGLANALTKPKKGKTRNIEKSWIAIFRAFVCFSKVYLRMSDKNDKVERDRKAEIRGEMPVTVKLGGGVLFEVENV